MVEIGTILIQISSPYAKKKFRADQCPLMVVFYMTLHSILRVGRNNFQEKFHLNAKLKLYSL